MCRTPRKSTEIAPESSVVSSAKDRTDIKPLIYWPRRFALTLIRFYQTAISSRTPPSCFFYPTCSHYTYQAIECFGLWRGAWLGLCRILRCHPFTQGGYDPVPEKFLWFPTRIRHEKANAESAQEGFQFEKSHEGSHKDLDE